jgi:NADPH-dependent F420 reductase
MTKKFTIGIVGGTGALGSGLAYRLSKAGYNVVLGSRDEARAKTAALELASKAGNANLSGATNHDSTAKADVVFLTVPYISHEDTLSEIANALHGKILVDVTVPLVPPKVSRVVLPPGGAVAAATQARLGEAVKVVSAFHNVAAKHLHDDDHSGDCDVLVFGNDREAREIVAQLAREIGLTAWHGGPVENSVVGEAITPMLIFINKFHGIDGAGIRITGGAP